MENENAFILGGYGFKDWNSLHSTSKDHEMLKEDQLQREFREI